MRVFEEEDFAKWARKERIPDATICQAARDVVAGQVEADLGGWLFKKRVARPGGGKSGGWRMIVAFRRPDDNRVVFLFGFAKNEASTLSDDGHKALATLARGFIQASDEAIDRLLRLGTIMEVICDEGPNRPNPEDGPQGGQGPARGGRDQRRHSAGHGRAVPAAGADL